MKINPAINNEAARIAALHQFKILDTEAEQDFDDIVELASQLCDTPFSLITLIDENRQWFKAKHGIDLIETSRDISFCSHTIEEPEIMVVADTSKDERFFNNPFVTGAPEIRFYAGLPLISEDGFALGTLCVLDQKPRTLTEQQIFSLRILAKQVLTLLKLRLKITDATSKLAAYFNSTSEAVCLMDTNYNLLDFNNSAQQYFHQVSGRLIAKGDNMLGYIESHEKDAFISDFSKALNGEKVLKDLARGSGELKRWLHVSFMPMRNTDRVITAIALTGSDITYRKNIEQTIATSQQYYKSLFEQNPDAVFSMDMQGGFTAVNESAALLAELSYEELMKMNFASFCAPEDLERALFHFNEVQKGIPQNYDVGMISATGKRYELSVTNMPIVIDGHIVGVYGIAKNITANKKAEEKIKRSVQQKQQIAQLSEAVGKTEKIEDIYELALNALEKTIAADRASIFLFDADGVIRFKASRGLSDEYLQAAEGHSPWQEDEKNPVPIFVPNVENEPSLKSLHAVILKEGIRALAFIPLVYQNRLIGKFMVYFNNEHILTEDEIQLTQTISSLVSHGIGQKKSELDLRESEKKYRDVVNNVQEIIFKTDVNGHFTFLNPVWTEITGFTVEESIGKYLVDFIHSDDRIKTIKNYTSLLNFEIDHCRHDMRLITTDGSIRWFEINKRLIIDGSNNATGTTGVLNDITEHKEAEQKLAENQRFLQTLINNLPGYVYRVKNDPTYTPDYISKGVVKITGHTADEYIVHRTISGAHSIAEVDKERIWNEVQHAIAQKLPYEFTYRMKNTSGSEKWVWERGQGIWNDDNELIATEGFITDITDYKTAEDQIKKEKELSDSIINNLPGIFYIYTDEGKFLRWNKNFETVTGYSASDISQMHPLDFYDTSDKPFIKKRIESVFKENVPGVVASVLTKDKRKIAFFFNSWSVIYEGKPCLIGMGVDLTERKKTEEALQKSEDNLRTVFEHTETAYALLNDRLEILSFNQPANDFSIKHYKKELETGANMMQIFPGERKDFIKSAFAKVFKGETIEYDNNLHYENEEESWYHIKYSPVTNKEKAIIGLVMSLGDITGRKKAEIELNKSFDLVSGQNKRLLNFSYIVSHNLRSHATNIKSILGLMEDPITEDERKEMMGHLKTVSNSLDETLHNLYEVISIQNNINLVFVPLNLNEYITKAIGVLNEQVTQKGAIINNYTKADATVRYNPAYLESILLNFISNAVKYSHPERKPVITIDCFYENNKPVLTIADNGVGIDLKRFGDKLFGMYKTFHGNADARGIGLFISKNQIDFMGGKVEVESQLNIGSTFKIYF